MRCEEIRERFIEFIYDEGGVPPENVEIQEHLDTCSACREELKELKQTRKYLQLWKDEAPLQKVAVVGRDTVLPWRFSWKYLRYTAIAAMIVLCFLALANTQITWNKSGFSISTHLIPGRQPGQDYYTKAEVVDLMKRALDDSEFHMNELNNLMMQKMLDTVEQERWMDLRLDRVHAAQHQNNN
jgi:predicted anti-sigma-YlaC factor YlaD